MTDRYYNRTIDRLGALRAQISELQAQAKTLENNIKAAGVDTIIEGDLFRGAVSYVDTARVDWKSVAAKLEPSHQLVTAHTKHSRTVRLTVSARQRNAA